MHVVLQLACLRWSMGEEGALSETGIQRLVVEAYVIWWKQAARIRRIHSGLRNVDRRWLLPLR